MKRLCTIVLFQRLFVDKKALQQSRSQNEEKYLGNIQFFGKIE